MSNQPERPWLVPDPWEVKRIAHGEAVRRGKERTADERDAYRRAYQRNWRRGRHDAEPIVGWLHELRCTGNHRGYRNANGGCVPIAVYRREEAAA